MAAVKPVAPVANPLVATDLRPDALIARGAQTLNNLGKADAKSQNILQNVVAHLILGADDLDRSSVAARSEAWKVIDGSLMENANERGRAQLSGYLRSALKCVVSLDVDGTYLTPWRDGDFAVSLRTAYDALRGADPIRPVPSIEKILKAAAKKIRKHYPAAVCEIDAPQDGVLRLTVQ
jgi:hypothetical protein